MLLVTTNDLLNLIYESSDTESVKLNNIEILKEFEVYKAEAVINGIKLLFKNHSPIKLEGVTMKQLFRPNYN